MFALLCAPFLIAGRTVNYTNILNPICHCRVGISKVEADVLVVLERNRFLCEFQTQPTYVIMWVVRVPGIPRISTVKQPCSPIVAYLPIFFPLLTACYHIPPFAFQYEVECFIIFCHHSILSTLIGSPFVKWHLSEHRHSSLVLPQMPYPSMSSYRNLSHSPQYFVLLVTVLLSIRVWVFLGAYNTRNL